MKFGDFIDCLCFSDRLTIRLWLYDGGFDIPIAMIQPNWEGVSTYLDHKITEIRIDESNDRVIDLKIILETPIFGQAFNPD